MDHVKLGPFELPPIGLGCMNLSSGYGPATAEARERLLPEALERGYRLFDTAAIYGHGDSENLIGTLLKPFRDQFVLASKGGLFRGDDGAPKVNGRPEVLRRECEKSLQRLDTEVIDLYYLHRLDPQVPVEESVGALGELVGEGKIQAIGLSEVCAETIRRGHREFPLSAVQSEYSLWSRTPERAVLPTCAELGITFVPFAPLGRGFLAGSATDLTAFDDGDIRLGIARPRFEPDNFAANLKLLQPLQQLADELGCTKAQLSLAWLLASSEHPMIPIPGTCRLDHMIENFDAGGIALTQAQYRLLDQAINDEQVAGARYSDPVMASIDSERD
ncbi:aldo/keto reductase [Motiliproteus coralliicola]|uniref:Aldo/keto reductase n=1 Tax=Motiliproteus coralliicola TaxID=2283196 RepID=A0A369WX34_9GAMM|nr:aldo/keto reductase [Motiliproteus coralliicola]RDE25096.1 aldo/keto reductase [Motiliproteus coralliicola]